MKVVLDTNVVVAAFRSASGASRLWLNAALDRVHVAAISVPLAMEYEAVLKRPAIRRTTGLDDDEIDRVLEALFKVCEPVELIYRLRPMLRDTGDEMVLETAVIGRVDALLTFNTKDFAGADRVGVNVLEPGPAWRMAKGAKP